MKDLKLTIDLLPKGAWNNDLSKILAKKDWDKIRTKCYERANHRCEICGYQTDELDAHEIWDFNIKAKTQTLKDIIAICSGCHGVKHYRNSERLGYGENAKKHFMKVNNCSEFDFGTHLAEAQILFAERNSVYYWKMIADLDKFGGKGISIPSTYRPKIENPYSEEDKTISRNYSSALPRILEINVDNYSGIISLKCDRTNKIEWFSREKIIKTKFNLGRRFITSLSVKGFTFPDIYFKLTGNGGEYISKTFNLKNWD